MLISLNSHNCLVATVLDNRALEFGLPLTTNIQTQSERVYTQQIKITTTKAGN